MAEKKNLICKHGCGAEFPMGPEGQAALMRHYRWDCPNNPNVQKRLQEKADKEAGSTTPDKPQSITGVDDEYLDEKEILDKIIAEVSKTVKRPAIVRMVKRHLGNKRESIETLAEALRIADIPPNQRNLILKNWAAHMDIPDIENVLDIEKGEIKATEKKKDEKEIVIDIDKELLKQLEDEKRHLQLLRFRRERKILEKEFQEPIKKDEDEKRTMIIDGVSLRLTPQEMLAWKRYQSEQEERMEERKRRDEERKQREEERMSKKDDGIVEWPIGDKILKVQQSTIPLLVFQQSQKKGDTGELTVLRDELKEHRNMFQQFQMQTFQKEIEELKAQTAQDPLDRLFFQKEKLEKLGLIQSGKLSAQDQMYAMDRKKLDTLLSVVVDKSRSTGAKVDALVDTMGPVAQDYVKTAILQMKGQQGGVAPEVTRTEADAQETLNKLEEVDNAMEQKISENKSPKVISVDKTIKKDKEQ